MQFYLNGYKPGDPFIEEPRSVPSRSGRKASLGTPTS